jgi:hypothetical protein
MTAKASLDFKVEVIESNPGANSSFQAQRIILNLPNGTLNFTVQGRTSGRNGCEIFVLDENKSVMMGKHYSSGFGFPISTTEVTRDIYETMEILIDEGNELPFSKEDIYPAVDRMINKCESRYGNLIPNSDFESQIIF